MIHADICVIGAGAGGLSVAAGAARLGRKTVLIEKGAMGGDCLNYGCVPSKALLAAAKRAAIMTEPDRLGVESGGAKVDFAAVMKHVRDTIAAIAPHDSQERFEGLGVKVIRASAKFLDRRTVEAEGVKIRARRFVIATGSRPVIPPIAGLDETPYLTNETLFDLKESPAALAIIGGGPVGVEMAQAFARLGSKVTLIDSGPILAREDRDAASIIRARLEGDGVEIRDETPVAGVGADPDASDRPQVIAIRLGDRSMLEATALLVAAGRAPAVDTLDLEAAGVRHSDDGVAVDRRLRTSNRRIYAVGDVTGGRMFTHVAGYHASLVIRDALFKARADNREELAPRVLYTDPELAQVGLTEDEARAAYGRRLKIVEKPFTASDRARAEGDARGTIKVVTRPNGEILGATIVSAGAGDLIGPWALAMANGLKIRAFTNMIAPYPTRGEMSKIAAGAWYESVVFSRRARLLVRLLNIFD